MHAVHFLNISTQGCLHGACCLEGGNVRELCYFGSTFNGNIADVRAIPFSNMLHPMVAFVWAVLPYIESSSSPG